MFPLPKFMYAIKYQRRCQDYQVRISGNIRATKFQWRCFKFWTTVEHFETEVGTLSTLVLKRRSNIQHELYKAPHKLEIELVDKLNIVILIGGQIILLLLILKKKKSFLLRSLVTFVRLERTVRYSVITCSLAQVPTYFSIRDQNDACGVRGPKYVPSVEDK